MPYFVYILKCADETLYCGITTNLERRISEHNNSKLGAKYTRGRGPFELIYSAKFLDRSSASKEEYRIKKLSKHQKFLLINNFKNRY